METSPTPEELRRFSTSSALLLALAVVGTYLLAFLDVWGSCDDFFWLAKLKQEPLAIIFFSGGEGRLLQGGLIALGFSFTETLGQLHWLRVLMLLNIWLVSVCIARFAFRESGDKIFALSLGVFATAAPAFLAMFAYSVAFSAPLCFLAIWPAVYWALSKKRSHFLLGMAGLVVSLAIYQPGAFIYFSYIAIWLAAKTRPMDVVKEVVSRSVKIWVVAVPIYYLIFMKLVFAFGMTPSNRVGLVPNILTKAGWFFAMPVRDALSLFVIFPSDPVMAHRATDSLSPSHISMSAALDALLSLNYLLPASIALVIVFGLWMFAGRQRKSFLISLGLFAVLLIFCYLPMLVSSSYWASFRTQFALYIICACLFLVALRQIANEKVRRAAFILCMVAAVGSGSYNLFCFVSYPLGTEWRSLNEQIANADLREGDEIALRPARLEDALAPGVRYSFGRPASAVDWSPEAMVRTALQEQGIASRHRVHILKPEESPPPGAKLISLQR